MTSEELDALLREMSRASAAWADGDEGRAWAAKESRRARADAVVDMSPAALDQRFREMAAVSALAMDLARAAG